MCFRRAKKIIVVGEGIHDKPDAQAWHVSHFYDDVI